MEILKIIIPEGTVERRLDAALSEILPDYSRSTITIWI
jgi:hypothetical protein